MLTAIRKHKALFTLGLAILILLLVMRKAVAATLVPVLAAAVFAGLFAPLAAWLQKKCSSGAAALLTLLLVLLAVAAFLGGILPMILRQGRALVETLPDYGARLMRWLESLKALLVSWGISAASFDQALASIPDAGQLAYTYGGKLLDALARSVGLLPAIAAVPVLVYYFLKDRRAISTSFYQLIPIAYRADAKRILSMMGREVGRFVRGQLMVSFIVGLLTAVGLLVAGVPYAAVLGATMGVFNLMPYFGPILGGAFILIVSAAQGKWFAALIVAVAVQQLESLIITPRVVGQSVELHPALVLIAILAGGYVANVVGILAAVPVVVSLRVLFQEIYRTNLPPDNLEPPDPPAPEKPKTSS